ncbi:MAG TPA: bifunctional oligoribonuclease/PAP phosphatase NrnA [Candidatus Hydrogenedentes bacterium]|nr:bifunctional oligoribonuclease/PAP phosphatase NrnA [Candidatus Hydrogenedentota bacterium]HPG68049.1 bifunctional oligoribonuclease/PAP phosphatase NrnA [Candidatus Hydrogenedentota bacterium]
MGKKIDLAGVASLLRSGNSFLVTSHENPDGDAMGSLLAIAHLLHSLGKDRVHLVSADPVPAIYRDLPWAERIADASGPWPEINVVVVLDVARKDRFEAVARRINPGMIVVVIDHHREASPCGDFHFVDPSYAATGEIVVELFEAAAMPLSREAAHCLYVAQATDTGGYRFSNTNARSHRIAARLIEAGVDAAAINERIFEVMPRPKFALLKRVLENQRFAIQGRVAYTCLQASDLDATGARGEDLEGLVNFMRNIEGVDVGILFREVDAATTKVSFRSRRVFDSAAFLERFGGGGHAPAAGATIPEPLDEVCRRVLSDLTAALEDSM